MTKRIDVPYGAMTILGLVKQGHSPWLGWDDGVAAKTPEGREAYLAREALIKACREGGLLTCEGILTQLGHGALDAQGSAA